MRTVALHLNYRNRCWLREHTEHVPTRRLDSANPTTGRREDAACAHASTAAFGYG